jgi:hypothetical protein
VRDEFSAQIIDLSAKQAGRVANRTEEAGKAWKQGRAAPDSASLITAARRHPKVQSWLLWKVAGEWSRLMSPRVLTELQMLLMRMADGTGDDAHAARAILQEIHRPRAGHEAQTAVRPVSASFHHDEAVERETFPLDVEAGSVAIAPGLSSLGEK